MSLKNTDPLPPLAGKIVASAKADIDDYGYGYVEIRFTDGTALKVQEIGQAGQLEWRLQIC